MSTPVANLSRIKPGMCPHGMPAGACPVCNGMGSASAPKKDNNVRKAGEMTWSECFAMGLRMKADKLRQQEMLEVRRDMQVSLLQLQTKMADAQRKLEMISDMMKNYPIPIKKVAEFTIKNLALPIIKLATNAISGLQNILTKTVQFFTNLKEQIQGIQDKLAAIFGELFNAKEKSIAKRFKTAGKKIFSLFFQEKPDEELEILEIERQEENLKLKNILKEIKKYPNEVANEANSTV